MAGGLLAVYVARSTHMGVGGVIYGGAERGKRVPLALKNVDLANRQYL